jgi:hypothetical protein
VGVLTQVRDVAEHGIDRVRVREANWSTNEVAGERSEAKAIRRREDELPTRAEHTKTLAKESVVIRNVLDDLKCNDAIERLVPKGQVERVLGLEAHAVGKVEINRKQGLDIRRDNFAASGAEVLDSEVEVTTTELQDMSVATLYRTHALSEDAAVASVEASSLEGSSTRPNDLMGDGRVAQAAKV